MAILAANPFAAVQSGNQPDRVIRNRQLRDMKTTLRPAQARATIEPLPPNVAASLAYSLA
jgi:hypothetical protein